MMRDPIHDPEILRRWDVPSTATLGSTVRLKGFVQEMRARLPFPLRKRLDVAGNQIALLAPSDPEDDGRIAAAVSTVLDAADDHPVIPREVEDILTIKPAERLRWLRDGRLRSSGTRTVRLRGRAKAVTFHVFDLRHIEDLLDRDAPAIWRVDDAEQAAENRRRAVAKAAERRRAHRERPAGRNASDLAGWEDFDADGLLR